MPITITSPTAMDATSTMAAITAINGRPCDVTARTTAPTPDAAGIRIMPSDPPIIGASPLFGTGWSSSGSAAGAVEFSSSGVGGT